MKIALDLASFNVVETNLDAFKEIITEYVDIVFANEEEAKGIYRTGHYRGFKDYFRHVRDCSHKNRS